MNKQTPCPCYGCDKRNPYCHSTCESYKTFSGTLKELSDKHAEQKRIESLIVDDLCRRRHKKNKRK